MSKRQLLTDALQRLGVIRTLEMFRARAGILVINHHRVGNANTSRFDHGGLSATPEQLYEVGVKSVPVVGVVPIRVGAPVLVS